MRTSAEPAPYLPILCAQPLRIEEAPPPPDLTSRPAAGAPPVPALNPTESAVAAANADAVRATNSTTADGAPADATDKPKEQEQDAAHVIVPPAPVAKTPPPILPDTSHPMVRPEDFLPYFQVPGARSAPEAPSTIPQSSATYIQSR